MKSRAAVAFAAGEPLKVVEIDVSPPRKGAVLVRITHAGVCHIDAYTLADDDPKGLFPAVLRHEGAGIVADLGEGVSSLKPGDHGIPLYTAECRCMGCSTFSAYTAVAEVSLAKVNPEANPEQVCLLGGGVTTGLGAVKNAAKVQPADTVAVFGLGGIDLAPFVTHTMPPERINEVFDLMHEGKSIRSVIHYEARA